VRVQCLAVVAFAAALGVLVGVASAKGPRTVPLTVSIRGSGTVRVTGDHVVACAKTACRQTIRGAAAES
jgi:hypothetical protein